MKNFSRQQKSIKSCLDWSNLALRKISENYVIRSEVVTLVSLKIYIQLIYGIYLNFPKITGVKVSVCGVNNFQTSENRRLMRASYDQQ